MAGLVGDNRIRTGVSRNCRTASPKTDKITLWLRFLLISRTEIAGSGDGPDQRTLAVAKHHSRKIAIGRARTGTTAKPQGSKLSADRCFTNP